MGRIRKIREAHIFALILYIMVCEENSFDLNQDRIKNACIFEIFLEKPYFSDFFPLKYPKTAEFFH